MTDVTTETDPAASTPEHPPGADLHLGGQAWAYPALEPLLVPITQAPTPHPGNPKRGDVQSVMESMRLNGIYRPIYYDQTTGHTLGGHTTTEAITALGATRLPVLGIQPDTLTALRILEADNATAEAGTYDVPAQIALLERVLAEQGDLAGTGRDEKFLTELAESLEAMNRVGLTDPDHVPPPPKGEPTTRLGDVWHLGRHRLICGDAASAGDLIALMREDRAAICFTSPPYNIGSNAALTPSATGDNKYGEGYDDDQLPAEWLKLCTEATTHALGHSQYVIVNLQMLAGNKVALIEYLHQWRSQLADIAIWDKTNAQPAMAVNVMNSRFEFLLFLTTEHVPSRAIKTGDFRGTVPNVVQTASAGAQNAYANEHAATFPAALPAWAIENFSSTGELVLDPFAGTGTTLIAAHDLGRVARLVEIDPRYVDVTCKRFQEHTGIMPTRNGEPHDFTT